MPTKSTSGIPEGMHTITPSLWFNGNCKEAIDFYQKSFGAELLGPVSMDDENGLVMHAMMKIGNSPIMMGDAWPESPECGPKFHTTVGMWLYVEDCDRLYKQAVTAGCKEMMPLWDAFWGDRMGKVVDPFGHTWAIASHKWIMSPEEMEQGQAEWEKSMESHGHHHEGCC